MDNIFAKTILKAYPALESVAKQIDDLVYKRALSTCGNFTNAQRHVEKVVSLMNKKNNLINLKLIADEVLSSLDRQDKLVLEGKYFKRKQVEDASYDLQISLRTYFRWVANAEDAFAKGLAVRGYDDKWFGANYFDQCWLADIYDDIKEKTQGN